MRLPRPRPSARTAEHAVRHGHAERHHQPAARRTTRACRTTTASSTSPSRPGQDAARSLELALPRATAASLNSRVRMILIDPTRQLAAHSLPAGRRQLRQRRRAGTRPPGPGPASSSATPGRRRHQRARPLAGRRPSGSRRSARSPRPRLTLHPGQSKTASVSRQRRPSAPGDAAGSLVISAQPDRPGHLDPGDAAQHRQPGARRRVLSGVLTGGNGRRQARARRTTTSSTCPAGVSDIAASVDARQRRRRPGRRVPRQPRRRRPSATARTGPADREREHRRDRVHASNPAPGTWTLVVAFAEPVDGQRGGRPVHRRRSRSTRQGQRRRPARQRPHHAGGGQAGTRSR